MALEEGILDMLHDFFCDELPHEERGVVDKEAKNKQERESEIKEQCNKMLYEGEKVSKVLVLLSLLNLQTIYGWSDISVLTLFQLLHKILLEENCMPESHQVAKKMLTMLGLDYKSIHSCPNDHPLFQKELANEEQCPQCDASCCCKDVQGNKIPNKVLRHFSLIP